MSNVHGITECDGKNPLLQEVRPMREEMERGFTPASAEDRKIISDLMREVEEHNGSIPASTEDAAPTEATKGMSPPNLPNGWLSKALSAPDICALCGKPSTPIPEVARMDTQELPPHPTKESLKQFDTVLTGISFVQYAEFKRYADAVERQLRASHATIERLQQHLMMANDRRDEIAEMLAKAESAIGGLLTQFDHAGCTCMDSSNDCCAYARAKQLLASPKEGA